MFDAPGLPAYPPARNTWHFPPPELPSRWKWIAIVAGVTGLALSVVLATALVVVGNRDFPGFIEDEALLDSIDAQCSLMTSTVQSLPVSGSRQRQAATVADQDRAIELMVATIRDDNPEALGTDRPAEQWLRDWERLLQARDAYALALLRDPNATLEIPVDADGDAITERMGDVWLGDPVCEVPDVLLSGATSDRADI